MLKNVYDFIWQNSVGAGMDRNYNINYLYLSTTFYILLLQ